LGFLGYKIVPIISFLGREERDTQIFYGAGLMFARTATGGTVVMHVYYLEKKWRFTMQVESDVPSVIGTLIWGGYKT